MTDREAFEAQIQKQFPTASDDFLLGRLSSGRYGSMVTEHAWLAWQAALGLERSKAQQERKPPLDTELFGVRDGVWVSMGMIATPPAMKAREIVRETFGPTTEDGCTDADICFDAMQQLIAHMVASGWKMAQQERKPMNEYDISELMRSGAYMDGPTEFIRAIEAFHGIGDKP